MKTVYLAGPITGLTYEGCTDWRDRVTAKLAVLGIKGLSPMRAKAYLRAIGEIGPTDDDYPQGVFSAQRGVVTRDYYDCTTCDILLVNLLGAKAVSIGTMMEIAWAWMKRTPVVLVMEPKGNVHEHMFVREMAGFRVETIDEAVSVIGGILS